MIVPRVAIGTDVHAFAAGRPCWVARLHWPDQDGLARWLAEAGFERVRWRNLTGGIVALHRGTVA